LNIGWGPSGGNAALAMDKDKMDNAHYAKNSATESQSPSVFSSTKTNTKTSSTKIK